MKILLFLTAASALLFFSVESKPPSKPDEDVYGPLAESDVQNDDAEYESDDYDNLGKAPEERPNPDEKLVFKTQGKQFIANVTDIVELPCEITGGTNFVRIWRRKDFILFQHKIPMGASKKMTLLPDGSLQIKDVEKEDSGDYECSVMITPENSPKIKHTLIVNVPPKITYIAAKDNKTDLRAGSTLELTCIAEGIPKPTISWHHLSKSSERLAVNGEKITISNVTHREAGTYRCLADNKIFKPANAKIDVKIEYKPIVSIEKISVSSDNKLDTELKCTVHSEPKATVVWKKNRQNIKNSEHTQLSNSDNDHILLIKELQESDFGEYECVAANYIGNTERTVKLIRTPAIVRFIKPQQPAKDVVLTWEVQSKTPISEHELQYRKKGNNEWTLVKPEVTQSEKDVFTVKYALKGLEPGVYETRVRSQNNHGWSEYSEIMPFSGVYDNKHGHHSKPHKKGHSKDKHFTTQDPTEDISIAPAEHQESEHQAKESPVGASQDGTSASCQLSVSFLLSALCLLQILLRQ